MAHPGCVLGLPISCHYGELRYVVFLFTTASASSTRNYAAVRLFIIDSTLQINTHESTYYYLLPGRRRLTKKPWPMSNLSVESPDPLSRAQAKLYPADNNLPCGDAG